MPLTETQTQGLLGASIGSTLVGSILGAVGSIQNAKAANAAAKYNAAIAKMQADQEAHRRRRLGRRAISAQFTQMAGKSGVTAAEGGWVEALARNAGEYEQDALNAEIAGRQTAALERARGRSAMRQGYFGAGASILGGASRVANLGLSIYGSGQQGQKYISEPEVVASQPWSKHVSEGRRYF